VTGDGRGSCDRRRPEPISSQALLDARELQRELAPLARRAASFPETGADMRRYVVRMREGSVSWSEDVSGLPAPLGRAMTLERDLEAQLCG
jgi:hypothetical protein